jgi:hypothetical protein
VIQNYFAIVSAQRKFNNAQTSVQEAERFLDITQKQEKGGEAAHADVIKAQIDLQQRQRDLQEAQVAIEKAKIALGVLIFPDFQLRLFRGGRSGNRLNAAAARRSADAGDGHQSRSEGRHRGHSGGRLRRPAWRAIGYLPSFGLDFFYGIDANQFAANTDHPTQIVRAQHAAELRGPNRQNLGYSAQATLNIPVWNWGATRSKVKQAELKRDQAQLDLAGAARLQSNHGRGLRGGAGGAGAARFAAQLGGSGGTKACGSRCCAIRRVKRRRSKWWTRRTP